MFAVFASIVIFQAIAVVAEKQQAVGHLTVPEIEDKLQVYIHGMSCMGLANAQWLALGMRPYSSTQCPQNPRESTHVEPAVARLRRALSRLARHQCFASYALHLRTSKYVRATVAL